MAEDYFTRKNIPRRGPVDLAEYPEDVRSVLAVLWDVWGIKPPKRERKKGGEFADTVQGARELLDAISEYDPRDVLEVLFVEYNLAIRKGRDVPTLGRPQAFVRSARALTARWRVEFQAEDAIRHRYLKGKLAGGDDVEGAVEEGATEDHPGAGEEGIEGEASAA
jgi:hypothetical protein